MELGGLPDRRILFIGGLHRSGTSILHRIMRVHPDISGFTDTGVPEDEGQHLQTLFPVGMAFGGPGRFGFDPRAYMDESHPLATREAAKMTSHRGIAKTAASISRLMLGSLVDLLTVAPLDAYAAEFRTEMGETRPQPRKRSHERHPDTSCPA